MKKVKRYQQKMIQGIVPTHYQRASASFLAGAHKHWAGKHPNEITRLVANDRADLDNARRAR